MLEDQSRRLWHSTNIYLHPTIHEYVEKLTAKMPGNLKVSAVGRCLPVVCDSVTVTMF